MIRGEARLRGRDIERIKGLAREVAIMRSRLDREYLDVPELEPALTEARETVAKLEGWCNEMAWIAEHELAP